MRTTLIAVAGLGLAVGGCTLRSPSGPAVYSSLQPEAVAVEAPVVAQAAIPATVGDEARVAALPPGFEPAPQPQAMPGDLIRPIPETARGRVDPNAALSASARARGHWEILKPGDVNSHSPLIARIARGEAGASAPAAASIAPSAAAAENYDREAAMQKLVNGGKSAGKPICSGC